MFLNGLSEENKEGFLNLCVYASFSNGVLAPEQKATIDEYCNEMNIIAAVPVVNETLEDFLTKYERGLTDRDKRIIVLEILSLIKSDGVYDKKEKKFMKTLLDIFGMSRHEFDRIDGLLNIYNVVCGEVDKLINE